MAYRRFELPEITFTPATLANPATVSADEAQSVADLASVAGAETKSAPPNPRSVAGLASVAGGRVNLVPPASAELVDGEFSPSAMPATLAAIPAPYRDAFAALCAMCPAGVPKS